MKYQETAGPVKSVIIMKQRVWGEALPRLKIAIEISNSNSNGLEYENPKEAKNFEKVARKFLSTYQATLS